MFPSSSSSLPFECRLLAAVSLWVGKTIRRQSVSLWVWKTIRRKSEDNQSVSELERQSEENLEMTSLTLASVLAAALTAVYSSRAKKTKKMQTPVHKSTAYNWIWMLYINPVGFSIWIWITLTFPQCCLAAIQRQGCSLRQHNVLAASYEFQDLRVLTRQRSRENLFVFRLNLLFFDKTPLCKQLGVASCWWRQSWLTLWAGW